ncbi:tetraspanin-1 [Patella vulgata]|uniref:tetraspanin-1 n=1 Tax=Patella vulgata TaxID=6465 RepID=UPI00217FEAF1|nr:tetraspanin-1 [Patella vulgata]
MCTCFASIGRLLISILSGVFALIGVVLFSLGIIMKVKPSLLDSSLQSAQGSLQQAAALASFPVPSTDININDLVGKLTIVLIVLGLFFLIVGILGIIGAYCEVRIVLIVYVIVVILLLLSQLLLVIIVFEYRELFDSTLKEHIKEVVKNDYTGINGTSAGSMALNILMISQGCCGIDNYTDFSEENAPNWQFRSFKDKDGMQHNLVTPMVCCKNTSQAPSCAETPDATDVNKNNYNKGCYDVIWQIVKDNEAISIGVVVGICALQLLLIIFGIIIIHQKGKLPV